jgi:outer membrane protein OmpA-like peptidoglycan-associated protein
MLNKPLWLILIVVLSTGCADLRKAELASGNDPDKAVAEVTKIMTKAQKDQVDVLADEAYAKGSEYLAEARQGLKQGESIDSILEDAAIAKAFFQDANKTAAPRGTFSRRILKARQSALSAGVRKSAPLVEILKDIDNDLKSATQQFSRSLPPQKFSAFQKRYLALEARAVQYTELNVAQKAINQAKKDDAGYVAPESLRTALLDYEAANNMIAQSPRNPRIYKKSVKDAVASATLLFDVMNVILGAKGTPEKIALQIVKQKRALGELSTNLKSAQQSLEEKEGKLKSQKEQLAKASTQVRFQEAMDEARKVLPKSDALVYQQGNKLVFRLKRVNFRSGTAIVPESSKPLISKVDSIIKKLDADKVVVQGHTDSVGSAEVNKRLSKKRALAVANYISSLRGGYKLSYIGYGEANPIASNETKDGRATNRRVDLVVSVKQ